MDEAIRAKAESLWAVMDDKERAGMVYGMFPTNQMLLVEEEGFDCYSVYLALMDCAAYGYHSRVQSDLVSNCKNK